MSNDGLIYTAKHSRSDMPLPWQGVPSEALNQTGIKQFVNSGNLHNNYASKEGTVEDDYIEDNNGIFNEEDIDDIDNVFRPNDSSAILDTDDYNVKSADYISVEDVTPVEVKQQLKDKKVVKINKTTNKPLQQNTVQISDTEWLTEAGLPFLAKTPKEPTQQICFDTDIGMLVTSFHAITVFPTVVQLTYDMRYNSGGYFALKATDKPIKVLIDNAEYSVVIPDFAVNIGCLNVQFLFKEE